MAYTQTASGIYTPNGASPAPGNDDGYVAELQERLAALEFALESMDWRLLTSQAEQEFSRAGLRQITELARILHLKNPLIKRGVSVKRFYIWGQGWTVQVDNDDIQTVIDEFLADEKNNDAIGSHEARMQLEIELETDGNLFFCFFVNQLTGRVRVRTVPFDEIEDILCNPEDSKEPWYYKRIWTERRTNMETGTSQTVQRTAYYPDWRYNPVVKPGTIGSHPVEWDKPVYHVKVGGYSNWKFGLSEIYASIDWAKAYKEFLEDWASIVRAYRRFAFKLSTPGGSRAVTAAKRKLNTNVGPTSGTDTNPPPLTGSTFIAGGGTDLQPVRTAGATVSAEDGRRLLLMVAADTGLPETFFGDASIGTLATAKSLDRPTELMMEDRQALWADVYGHIFTFVVRWAVKAVQGPLRGLGRVTTAIEDGERVDRLEWAEDVEGDVSIEFPPLLQHDISAMIDATVKSATLGAAGQLAGTIDLPTLSRVLLSTLGVPDVDVIVERLFPDGEVPEEEENEMPQAEAMMVEAVKELRDELLKLREGNA